MNNIAIKVENISKTFKIPQERRDTLREHFWNFLRPVRYKKFEALKNISFEVKRGEWLGIIGRNGSGKSTLLKVLAGIYQSDTGQVIRNGKIVPFLELGVGFNPQLSARENIFLNGTILGMTRRQLEKKFDEIVDFAEIRQFLDMPLKNFSSGMQVRLAFAIASQVEGDIYLLDEVLAVGDMRFQQKCKGILKKFVKQGKTVLFVSHNMESIREYCKKSILLSNGKILAFDDSEKVIFKYSTIDTAQKPIKKDNKKIAKNLKQTENQKKS